MASTESKTFEAALLPDSIKEDMCRSLLAEFGVTSISVREPDGELIHRCCLPWHPEKKPSASLNYKKLTYKCLGCQASGGLLWLIGTVRHASGTEARQWVETQTGLGAGDFDLSALLGLFDALYSEDKRSGPPPMPRFSMRALDPWAFVHPWLTIGAPDLGIPGRGIPAETVESMKVGYAEEYPMGKGEPTSERIIIPHMWKGHLVGWQSRRLWDDGTPKYKSTPDFPKDRTLFNYDPKRKWAVAVESPMTALRHLHHLPVEATFGASVTDNQVRLLAAHERVILWMDPDPAGWNATAGWADNKGDHHPGLGERLEPYSEVLVVDSPWAADGADMDDVSARDLCVDAVPYSVWRRPKHLLCWICKAEHDGGCP